MRKELCWGLWLFLGAYRWVSSPSSFSKQSKRNSENGRFRKEIENQVWLIYSNHWATLLMPIQLYKPQCFSRVCPNTEAIYPDWCAAWPPLLSKTVTMCGISLYPICPQLSQAWEDEGKLQRDRSIAYKLWRTDRIWMLSGWMHREWEPKHRGRKALDATS